ncbi:unnamed protein product [Lymnaea stagnalis]|uniref:G-protein coupled receptors family 1 profile domain-containing protein n=1 Tax=Lymnaea stagnalis TaxID=6523 RepID=A0AAV2HWZ3_LYMST
MPFVSALGIVGNLLSLMVLTTEKLHRTLNKMEISAHIGLIALAVSDFLFCLLVLIFTQAPSYKIFEDGDSWIYFRFMADGLITVFITSSTWLIVVMAAERYIAVCHPLRARKLISLRRTRASIIIVFVVCAMATIPIFLKHEIQEKICADGRTVYVLKQHSEGSVQLRRIIWSIFFDFIPCAALVYFNLCLIIQIRRAKRLRDEMTPKHSIIRYSSSGTKISAQSTMHANLAHNKRNGLYNHRTRGRNDQQEANSVAAKSDNKDQVKDSNGVSKYSKFMAFPGVRHKFSKASLASRSDSTENEFQALNDAQRMPRPVTPTSSVKVRVTENINRKRPSDSALNSVTATLVAVVLLFLIFVSPSELLKFSIEYTSASLEQKSIVKDVTNFMQVLNFSLNFVLYCAVNKTFRHTLHGLVCCCWLSLRG